MKEINLQLTPVGKLLKELKKYEKEHWSDCVVAWMDDGRTFGVVGMGPDKDGDLQIVVEEVDGVLEGIWSVEDVIDSLEQSGKETRAYLAGDGLSFAIGSKGGIFTEADNDNIIGCNATVFGEYEEEPEKKPVLTNKHIIYEDIALTVLALLGMTTFGYSIYGLVTKSGSAFVEHILWIIASAVIVVVCGLTLYYSHGKQ